MVEGVVVSEATVFTLVVALATLEPGAAVVVEDSLDREREEKFP